MRLLAEDVLATLPQLITTKQTPTGVDYQGVELAVDMSHTCVISIMRSGDALLDSFRDMEPGLKVGKLLIQRDETSLEKKAVFFYYREILKMILWLFQAQQVLQNFVY